MPAMDLGCDWACDTCPWMAITRTLPLGSRSMAICITGTIVASLRTHGSALLSWQSTQENEDYLRTTCGYTLVIIWECEWEVLKRSDPHKVAVCKGQTGEDPQLPLPGTSLPDPGANMELILQAICEDWVFGLAQVDIHTPEDLKDKFRDLPSIFNSAMLLSIEEAGPHMARFCETAGLVSRPWMSLISSYFAHRVLIPTPLLQWYLLNGLVVTQLYILMQYNRRRCFQALAENCAPPPCPPCWPHFPSASGT